MTRLNHSDISGGSSEGNGDLCASPATAPVHVACRVLVVDDEISIREVTSAMLADLGYEVLTAVDGQDALEILSRFTPDVVITDLQMPRLSGFELVEIMRERFPTIPVIAVSGEFSDDDPPPTVPADAFVSKGGSYIGLLTCKIQELFSTGDCHVGGELNSGIAD